LSEVEPALAVGGFDVLAFDERTLVQQGDPIVLKGELVELAQEVMPGRVIGARVNRVDRENLLIVRVRQDRAGVLANVIGAERHVAPKSGSLEVLIREVEVGAQRG
jgi:hypothetical protein